jgi:hypothetical protein
MDRPVSHCGTGGKWPGTSGPGGRNPVRLMLTLLGLIAVNCRSAGSEGRRRTDSSPVIARVGAEVLSQADLRALIRRQPDPAAVFASEGGRRGHRRRGGREVLDSHAGEFTRPEEVHVAEVKVKDRASARAAAAAAAQVRSSDAAVDEASFREIVSKFSDDPQARVRGGDLGFLRRGDPEPRPRCRRSRMSPCRNLVADLGWRSSSRMPKRRHRSRSSMDAARRPAHVHRHWRVHPHAPRPRRVRSRARSRGRRRRCRRRHARGSRGGGRGRGRPWRRRAG